jgi:hypothetical protein
MAIITINGNSIDPDAPVETLRAFGLVQETAKASNHILIQINAPLTKEIKQELADKHVKIREKVSDGTYLCLYEPEVCTVHVLRLAPYMRWLPGSVYAYSL